MPETQRNPAVVPPGQEYLDHPDLTLDDPDSPHPPTITCFWCPTPTQNPSTTPGNPNNRTHALAIGTWHNHPVCREHAITFVKEFNPRIPYNPPNA